MRRQTHLYSEIKGSCRIIKKIGLDTAKAVLNAPREVLIEKADLEEDTVDHVIEVLKAEFEDEE